MPNPQTPRHPLDDEKAEKARTEAYWAALDRSPPGGDCAERIGDASEGRFWVRLATSADADYEAYRMRHSIGHSFDRYAAFGTLLSLRSPENVPLMTVLVSGNRAIHYREERNSRPCAAHLADLERFMALTGGSVAPEDGAFDDFDGEGRNTRLAWVRRGGDGSKTFGEVVLRGRHSRAVLRNEDAAFPAALIYPEAEDDDTLEIVCLSPTDDPATTRLATGTFAAALGTAPNRALAV
jgi:hypothetical protein